MRAVALLLGKDLRRLGRSPALAVALIAYPLVVALLVGLLVRYAGERPRVALVDHDGLPAAVVVGGTRFDIRRLLADAAEVELVAMSEEQAERELASGRSLAALVVPEGFTADLRGLRKSPRLVLRTSAGGLSGRVVEQIRALVYGLNLQLQQAYIDANLAYVELLERGGSGRIGDERVTVLGLARAERELRELGAVELAAFMAQVRGAVGQVGDFLRATANPIELVRAERPGRTWILSAQVQAYALALTLAFLATLVGAAAVAWERDDDVVRRLLRGLVSVRALLVEKVALAALVAGSLGATVLLALGVMLEVAGVEGGQPWGRLPLAVAGLAVAATAFGAFGAAVGTVVREAGAATLVAFLAALPASLLGALPTESLPVAAAAGDLFPFGHAARLVESSLYEIDPWATVAREGAWLAALTVAYWLCARAAARRLL